MHIVDMVVYWARANPNRPAIIQPDGVITYRGLAQAIESAAANFAASIPDRSKPVAVSMTSPAKLLAASLGLLRAGYSIIPLAPNQIALATEADGNTLVHERDGATLDGGMNVLFDDNWLRVGHNAEQITKPIRQTCTRPSDTIFFTSGTTGTPKKVVKTQAAWDQRMILPSSALLGNFERVLIASGLSSSYGFTRVYEILHGGKTACFAPFGSPMLWLVDTYDIDMIIASTQQALALAEIHKTGPRYALAGLRYLRIGGGRLSAEGATRLKNCLCRNIINHYGSTEAGMTAVAFYDTIADVPDAVGYLLPGIDIEVIDHAGRVLPAGSEGLIRLRSPQFIKNLAPGDDPSAWFYPGDIGRVTPDGVLCITSRTDDVINRGGVKLSATELEAELTAYPDIQDATVCSIMGQSGREEIWVAVVFKPSIDPIAFQKHFNSREQLSANIDRLFVVESIPRGEMGKVLKPQLVELLQQIESASQSAN